MHSPTRSLLQQTTRTGVVSGLLMAAVIAGLSRARTGRSARGVNAVSHMLWGREAATQPGWSLRYSLNGLWLNELACLFWAGYYEALRRNRRSPLPAHPAAHAVILSFIAYLVDYHIVPKRFTPGFELVFPRTWFPFLYAGLAGSLWAGGHRTDRPPLPDDRRDRCRPVMDDVRLSRPPASS